MTDRHQDPSYPLRMPKQLRERLERAAEEAGRSVNAEIVARLRESFESKPSHDLEEIVAIVKATVDELQRRDLLVKPPPRTGR